MNLKYVEVDKIVVNNKIKGNNETSKVFISYMGEESVKPICIILPQIGGWIKYFENSGKNMSFKIEDDEVYMKYNSICKKVKELLDSIKFYSEPFYDDQYIKTKVKTFIDVVRTLFDGETPKERIEYSCIACISVDSVLKVDKKWYPQVFFEQCKYKIKKREIIDDYEINLDSSDYESD